MAANVSTMLGDSPLADDAEEARYVEGTAAFVSADSDVKGIANALASGLLKSIAGKVGALIFESIFPPGVPNYFAEVYNEIEKIVKKELTQNTVDEINGRINGLKDWVTITYKNAKAKGLSKEELTKLLQPREPQIEIDLVSVLKENRFAEPGICVFMIGAGVHLAILQELAFVDASVSSPNMSHYAQSIEDYAKQYADHAKTTTNHIYQSRKNMVKPSDEEFVSPTQRGITQYLYGFEDAFTGYKSKTWSNTNTYLGDSDPEAYKNRNAALENYVNEKVNELVKKMQDPVSTADEWLKLVEQPLPK